MQMWLLTVGEYSDEMVLGVVRGTRTDAIRRAAELTSERGRAGESDDMIYVAVRESEDLTVVTGLDGWRHEQADTVSVPRAEYAKWVEVLGKADALIDGIFDRIERRVPESVIADADTRSELSAIGNWVRACQRRMAKVIDR